MSFYSFLDQQSPLSGLNGGTIWERPRQIEQQLANDVKAEHAPKCIRLMARNGRDYQDEVQLMAVSLDGVIGGIFVQDGEIFIYQFMGPGGELLHDQLA